LIDLSEAEQSDMRYFCQSVNDLFAHESLRKRFRDLQMLEKLRALEIKLKPTGFTLLAGRGQSYRSLGARILGNTCAFERDTI
jgi:hypothetical protein